jgi:biotin-(acetyl-CoA carboxylase) ligase
MKPIGQLSRDSLSTNINTLYFESIDSTNTYAKENFEQFQFPTLIVADAQTQGRGRKQNTWSGSASGHALYATWAYKLSNAPSPILSMRVGLQLYLAIEKSFKIDISLKAPNDIYIDKKKLAGILIEGIHFKQEFYTFIGIGLNVKSSPLDLASHLQNHCSLTEEQWNFFLLLWQQKLNDSIHQGGNLLSSTEQLQLLTALKKHSQFLHLQSISAHGDLIFPEKTLSWSDL